MFPIMDKRPESENFTRIPPPEVAARLASEVAFDLGAIERFKAANGGKTPLEVIAARFPAMQEALDAINGSSGRS